MKKLLALMAMLFLMLFVACQVSDTTDDTDTDIAVATLLNEAGLPVPNATVRVYTFRDSTGIPVDSTVTNANGSYELEASLTPGSYSLWAETDSSVLFREDLIIKTDSSFVDTNTLVSARKICVPVKMHKDHDPRTVEAQIWGTPIRHNVSVEGFLILDKITTGTYFTRLTTTLEGYTPTNDSFTITALSPDTLLDTLELIYTGLPRVVVGSVVLSDGTPAVNATVRVFPYRDSTGLWVDSLLVDADGNFETKQLVAGRYSLWIEGETEMSFREDIIVAENEKTVVADTLKTARKIWVPVKVQPNHTPQMVEVQLWGTPIQQNVSSNGYLVLDKIAAGSYFTRLNTTLDGYVATNDTIAITALSPDTLTDTLELIYTSIPVVIGLAYTYDTLNTVVNLTWNQSSFTDIQAYVIERKLKSETVWPTMPLANVYVNQTIHPTVYSDTVTVGETGAIYQYRIKILNNSSVAGMPFGVLEVNAVSSSNAVTTITASSMQKAKAIVGNRASINDVMSFNVNFSNPTRKLTQLEWYEGEVLLKTTPLTELITTDSFEKSWPTIGAKNLTVKITDDAGFVWVKDVPVSIVEDKPVISFVDTTINLNVLDTLTAVVSDEFGEIVSYQWDWGNDGTIDATTPQFVKTQKEFFTNKTNKLIVIDDDGVRCELLFNSSCNFIWEKIADGTVGFLPPGEEMQPLYFEGKEGRYYVKSQKLFWKTSDGIHWESIPFNSALNGASLKTTFVCFKNEVWCLEYTFDQESNIEKAILSISLKKSRDLYEWHNIESIQILFDKKDTTQDTKIRQRPLLYLHGDSLYCNIMDLKSFHGLILNEKLEDINNYKTADGINWTVTDYVMGARSSTICWTINGQMMKTIYGNNIKLFSWFDDLYMLFTYNLGPYPHVEKVTAKDYTYIENPGYKSSNYLLGVYEHVFDDLGCLLDFEKNARVKYEFKEGQLFVLNGRIFSIAADGVFTLK